MDRYQGPASLISGQLEIAVKADLSARDGGWHGTAESDDIRRIVKDSFGEVLTVRMRGGSEGNAFAQNAARLPGVVRLTGQGPAPF